MNIFVDLEMQGIKKAAERVTGPCHREVIEIGAVAADEQGKVQDRFRTYVRPLYSSRISAKVTGLTGIRTEDVVGAELFGEAFHAFMDWCCQQEAPVVYAWSEADYTQLVNECGMKQVRITAAEQAILDGWRDLQKEFDELIGAESQTGLEKAVDLCGLANDGRRHDAYWDAWNTARVYTATRNRDAFLRSMEDRKRILSDRTEPLTLGSMIDFSAFQLPA